MFSDTIAMRDREVASHLAHTQEIAGSSPAPATKKCLKIIGAALKDCVTRAENLSAKDGISKHRKERTFALGIPLNRLTIGWKINTRISIEV